MNGQWTSGDYGDFLGMSKEERADTELRLALESVARAAEALEAAFSEASKLDINDPATVYYQRHAEYGDAFKSLRAALAKLAEVRRGS